MDYFLSGTDPDPVRVGERGGLYYAEMDETDLELRQNLLDQFRKWKSRRRRKWNVRQAMTKHIMKKVS